jgi:hypothetical protein
VLVHDRLIGGNSERRYRLGVIGGVNWGCACGVHWSCPVEPGCVDDGITLSVGLAFRTGSAGPGVCAHEQ